MLNAGNPIGYMSGAAVTGTVTILQATTIYDLGVGDYVELFAYQTSGVPLNSEVSADYAPAFMMSRIG